MAEECGDPEFHQHMAYEYMLANCNPILVFELDDEILKRFNKWHRIRHPQKRKDSITKPWHPSVNEWMRQDTFNLAGKFKKPWKEMVEFLCDMNSITSDIKQNFMMPWPYAHLTLIYFFPDARARDSDNYAAKFLRDGLVDEGILKDDSYPHIGHPRIFVEKCKERKGMLIILEPITYKQWKHSYSLEERVWQGSRLGSEIRCREGICTEGSDSGKTVKEKFRFIRIGLQSWITRSSVQGFPGTSSMPAAGAQEGKG